MTEATMTYCKVCGHAKEHHDLNVHLDPKHHVKAREEAAQGHGACRDNSFGDNHCICVEFESWT